MIHKTACEWEIEKTEKVIGKTLDELLEKSTEVLDPQEEEKLWSELRKSQQYYHMHDSYQTYAHIWSKFCYRSDEKQREALLLEAEEKLQNGTDEQKAVLEDMRIWYEIGIETRKYLVSFKPEETNDPVGS